MHTHTHTHTISINHFTSIAVFKKFQYDTMDYERINKSQPKSDLFR